MGGSATVATYARSPVFMRVFKPCQMKTMRLWGRQSQPKNARFPQFLRVFAGFSPIYTDFQPFLVTFGPAGSVFSGGWDM
jgi:hypothetical protein